MLWVGGEAWKTAGPTLRGAARSRTLQEGPSMCCGLAVKPGKPRVPHCEERPGAAHSRRDPECVGWPLGTGSMVSISSGPVFSALCVLR